MVDKIEYETPINCMKRLTQKDNSDEFIISIKLAANNSNEINYQTTLNKARVISHNINEIYCIDPTITNYELIIPNFFFKFCQEEKGGKLELISSIVDLIIKSTSEKIVIQKNKKQQINIILSLFGETIGNEDSALIENINEAISYLSTQFHDQSIKYLSDHINEMIDEGQIFNLDDKIINEIIDSYFNETNNKQQETDKNSIKTEYEQIFNKLKKTDEIGLVMHFLLQIESDKYTKEMRDYITSNISDDIVFNELNLIIKQYIYQLNNVKNQMKCEMKNKLQNEIKIEYTDNELNGIINYLKNKFGQNLCESGIINISDCGHHHHVYGSLLNLIKYDNDNINQFYENNGGENPIPTERDGWIEFDFLKRKINLTSYTLRAHQDYLPKSWRIMGSNDRNEWELISERTDNLFMRGRYRQCRFECENNQKYYQYIRYVLDDSWRSDRKHNVNLTAIEFFGSISE